MPMQSFDYTFVASPVGTHWFHSQIGAQYADGLFGVLIVEASEDSYEGLPKFLLTMTEWWHRYAIDQSDILTTHPTNHHHRCPVFLSGIMNGKDRYDCSLIEQPLLMLNITGEEQNQLDDNLICAFYRPYERCTIAYNQTYRFRLIATGSELNYQFSIDNHNLTIVAIDGVYVQPYEVQQVWIYISQRYDVLKQSKIIMPPPNQSTQTPSQQLTTRENSQFKKLVRFYEQKQYKKGLAAAREILKKFPNHGETLSMKGLILNSMGRKEEALENIRNGIKNNITSHVVWHVYGLWQRSERKYDEAIKAYKKALQCEKDSLTILRDLSLLQIQMRDLDGYKETRHQLFNLKPGQRQSWVGFAMSYHLLGDYDMAQSVLEEFRKTQQDRPAPSPDKLYDNEHSEYLLYQNLVLRESGQYEDALRHIQVHEKDIYNKLVLAEIKYDLYMRLGTNDRAETILRDLIERNTGNKKYYYMLEECLHLTNIDDKTKLYENLIEKYPKADAPKQISLQFLTGEPFAKAVGLYLQRGLQKGVPSLFQSVKFLYATPEKIQIIDTLLRTYLNNLIKYGTFEISSGIENLTKETEPPTSLLWLQYYLAQHYDYLGDINKAFEYINQAICDTPTLVELYMFKAKIFKHAGDFQTAASWMDEAQSLDTADRFVNCKCTKYLLRANQINNALEIAGKFTRENSLPADYLREMQCMWFELEMARAYRRLKKYGEALKKCHEIDRHFQEFIEDQFDFHSYCLRKMVLCAYVDMLNLEDHMKGHRFFRQAAEIAVEIYIRLYDHPLSGQDNDTNDNLANMSIGEAKKLKNKLRKQQLREQQEKQKQIEVERRKKEFQRSRNKDDGEEEKVKEEEIVAEKLEHCEKPLEEAMRFLQPLEDFSGNFIQTHYLGFEVYYRRKKYLLMLRCLKRMKKLDTNHPKLHSCLMKFLKLVKTEPIVDERLRTLIDEELKIFDIKQEDSIKNIEEFNENFIKNHSNSLSYRAEAVKIMLLINPKNNFKAIEFLTTLNSNFIDQNLKVCSNIYENMQLGDYGSIESSIIEKYRLECNHLWPQANLFQINPSSTFDQSQSSAPPSYSSCDSQIDGGEVITNNQN
ncbi:unnamed protein product [Rotaria sordida]|uniref:Uncharacterized protein n=1 Tax=Rotaria sordida TaxID=392033 RepID=A0A814BSK7_9BILA|nr:unnamed protein product [Rotaria sordida]CAF0932213.1 unnamed protein product [Rotaria sordida]